MGKLEDEYAVSGEGLNVVGIDPQDGWEGAIDALADGRLDGVFFVGGLATPLMNTYASAASKGLAMATIKDRDLDDDGVYTPVSIESKHYPVLGGFSTIATEAVLASTREVEAALKAANVWRPLTRALSDAAESIRAGQNLKMVSGL